MQEQSYISSPLTETEEFKWNELLLFIENKMVVPVFGRGLYQLKNSKNSTRELLYDNMQRELAQEFGEEFNENECCEFFERHKKSLPAHIRVYLKKNHDKINKDPLIKLAEISDFQHYICMTYDNFFEEILEKERCSNAEKIETIDFSINNNAISRVHDESETVATVYNLMGSVKKINGFAKTEEEVLEHLYSLTKENPFSSKFFKDIEEKHFLFIGCNFPNWLLRFLLRILSRERLNEANILKIIADRTTSNDKKLCLFLNHFNSKVYPVPNSTSIKFVDALYKQWKARNNDADTNKKKYEGTVFLSYCSEDRENFAEKLHEILELRGVNVFFDKNKLHAGDYFKEKIFQAIKDCSLFIPLISENSLNPDRFASKEWMYALGKEKYDNPGMEATGYTSFIKPFIIDKTLPNDTRVINYFQHISVQIEKDIDKIVDSIISTLDS